jgi:hypothetical protein
MRMEIAMPSGPPTNATHFALRSSLNENSSPTENINSTTPISARSSIE